METNVKKSVLAPNFRWNLLKKMSSTSVYTIYSVVGHFEDSYFQTYYEITYISLEGHSHTFCYQTLLQLQDNMFHVKHSDAFYEKKKRKMFPVGDLNTLMRLYYDKRHRI